MLLGIGSKNADNGRLPRQLIQSQSCFLIKEETFEPAYSVCLTCQQGTKQVWNEITLLRWLTYTCQELGSV